MASGDAGLINCSMVGLDCAASGGAVAMTQVAVSARMAGERRSIRTSSYWLLAIGYRLRHERNTRSVVWLLACDRRSDRSLAARGLVARDEGVGRHGADE